MAVARMANHHPLMSLLLPPRGVARCNAESVTAAVARGEAEGAQLDMR